MAPFIMPIIRNPLSVPGIITAQEIMAGSRFDGVSGEAQCKIKIYSPLLKKQGKPAIKGTEIDA